MSLQGGDWDSGPPVPDGMDNLLVRKTQEGRKSMMVKLGDHPTPQQIQAAVNAVAQVSREMGVDYSPRLYLQGNVEPPNGYVQAAEHLHRGGPVLMSHVSSNLDNGSSHSVPVWIPSTEKVTDNPLVAAHTPATYRTDNVPADALVNGHTRLYVNHLTAATGAQPELHADLLKSRFNGEKPRFLAMHIPADDSVMPAVGLGVDAAQQAAGALAPAGATPDRTVIGHQQGRTWYLDAPDNLLHQRAISLLRRLGYDGAIKRSDLAKQREATA